MTMEVTGRDGAVRVWVYQLTGRQELALDRGIGAAQRAEDPEGALYDLALGTVAGQVKRVDVPETEDWEPCPGDAEGREAWLDAAGAAVVYRLLSALRPRLEDGAGDLGKSGSGAH